MTKDSEREKQRENFNCIIQEIIKGNAQSALNEFFNLYGRLIFTTAKSRSKSDDIANEVVDDVMIKIWRKADKIKSVANPEGFIYKMAVNCTRDKIKQYKLADQIFELPAEDMNIERIELDDAFEAMLVPLNPVERDVVYMRLNDELPFSYIANVLNKTVSSVSTIYYRALEKIMKIYGKQKIF